MDSLTEESFAFKSASILCVLYSTYVVALQTATQAPRWLVLTSAAPLAWLLVPAVYDPARAANTSHRSVEFSPDFFLAGTLYNGGASELAAAAAAGGIGASLAVTFVVELGYVLRVFACGASKHIKFPLSRSVCGEELSNFLDSWVVGALVIQFFFAVDVLTRFGARARVSSPRLGEAVAFAAAHAAALTADFFDLYRFTSDAGRNLEMSVRAVAFTARAALHVTVAVPVLNVEALVPANRKRDFWLVVAFATSGAVLERALALALYGAQIDFRLLPLFKLDDGEAVIHASSLITAVYVLGVDVFFLASVCINFTRASRKFRERGKIEHEPVAAPYHGTQRLRRAAPGAGLPPRV